MYSRYSNRQRTSVQIPEHYSGVAFSEKGTENEAPRYLEIAKPSPPVWDEPPTPPPKDEPPALPVSTEKPRTPFSRGLDFDQLLILGLILLLWGNERDGDVILWLGLLLLWS